MAKPSDFVVDNASGSAVRTDLNNIFDAISINNGFGSVPTVKYKYMWYADESSGNMSFYKANATDKLDFISLSTGAFFGPDGSTTNPSYTFSNSTSTGLYRPNANQIGLSCNGFNSAVFKETGFDIFGDLLINHPAGEDSKIEITAAGSSDNAFIDLVADSTYSDYGLRIKRNDGANGVSEILHRGTGNLDISTDEASAIRFTTDSTARYEINENGAFQWQGNTGTITGTIGDGVLAPAGYRSRAGTTASQGFGGNDWNFFWNGSSLQMHIDNVHVGNIALVSDYRVKQNITTQTESGINKVKLLRPVTYQYKDHLVFKADSVTREGFIAHEVQEIIPSGASGTKDGEQVQSLEIDSIVSVLTKALQEAIAKIEVLETKVAALEAS